MEKEKHTFNKVTKDEAIAKKTFDTFKVLITRGNVCATVLVVD